LEKFAQCSAGKLETAGSVCAFVPSDDTLLST
jgi:hypothetical protein